MTAALFWSAFEQKPISFNLFAQDFTNRQFLGFEIPAVWFQSVNPILIVIFAPIAAWLWMKLGKSNRDPIYYCLGIGSLRLWLNGSCKPFCDPKSRKYGFTTVADRCNVIFNLR